MYVLVCFRSHFFAWLYILRMVSWGEIWCKWLALWWLENSLRHMYKDRDQKMDHAWRWMTLFLLKVAKSLKIYSISYNEQNYGSLKSRFFEDRGLYWYPSKFKLWAGTCSKIWGSNTRRGRSNFFVPFSFHFHFLSKKLNIDT